MRKNPGATGPTGNPVPGSPTTVYTGLPALVDQAPRVAGQMMFSVAGEMIQETDYGYIDGLMPKYFVGLTPGQSFTYSGFTFYVAANGRAAFPDVKAYDVAIREDGTHYLIVGVNLYYDVLPLMMLHLNFGKSWT